jgi:hypothetical protein
MARKNVDPFVRLQQQARGLMQVLVSEIKSKKGELAQLESELEKLTTLTGRQNGSTATRAVVAQRSRIDWSGVLAKLPKEFKASDIRGVRGLKEKPPSELFAAITRWIDAGAVKKKERGVYLRQVDDAKP